MTGWRCAAAVCGWALCLMLAACTAASPAPGAPAAIGNGDAVVAGAERESIVFPTLVPIDVMIPFPVGDDVTMIAQISIDVSDTLQLDEQNSRVVKGYGSDLVRLRGGPLTLELVDENGVPFNLAAEDPRAVHVYDTADPSLPHATSLQEPPLLLDSRPVEWSFMFPLVDEYYERKINRLNLRDGDILIFSAGIDLDANRIDPIVLPNPEAGSYAQPGEIPTAGDSTIVLDPVAGQETARATVEGEEQPTIAVDTGTLSVSTADPMTRVGMRIDVGGIAGAEAPSLEFVVGGEAFAYTLDQLTQVSGQTIVLPNGEDLHVAAVETAAGTILDVQSTGAALDQVTVSGAGYQISELAVQTAP